MRKIIVFALLSIILPSLAGEGLGGEAFAQTHNWYTVNGWKDGGPSSLKVLNGNLYAGGILCLDTFCQRVYVMKFDGTTEDSVGHAFLSGTPSSFEMYNGELYGGGGGYAGSGQPWPNDFVPNTDGLAKYNGTQWMAVDSPMNGFNVLQYKNDLYLGGGAFIQAGNCTGCRFIARYNGSSWNNMQGGLSMATGILAMTVFNGELIVGGTFGKAGNVLCNNIARWNGTQWDSLGKGIDDPWGEVRSFAVDTVNNILYVGGVFSSAGGIPIPSIAAWDGTKWLTLGNPPAGFGQHGICCNPGMVMFDNKLYVASVGATDDSLLWRWDGTNWEFVRGPNNSYINTLVVYRGNLYAAGTFQNIYTTVVKGFACYGDSCPGTVIPAGIKETKQSALKFKIYPNPAKREITVETSPPAPLQRRGEYIVRLKNSLGQNIFEKKFEKKIVINTGEFKAGIYLVEVCTLAGVVCHTEKVVIE